MNNQLISNLGVATLPSQAVRFDQLVNTAVANEYIELASNSLTIAVNTPLLHAFYNVYTNTLKATNNIIYNGNGTITLKAGSY